MSLVFDSDGGKEEEKLLEEQHQKVQDEIAQLSPDQQVIVRAAQRDADLAMAEASDFFFNFDHENRIRQAGYLPSEAEDIARLSRAVGVGRMFSYKGKALILTPFKTVVDSQVYIEAIQDRLLQLTSVPAEVEIINLKKQIREFTSLSVLDLIKLTFKKLLK